MPEDPGGGRLFTVGIPVFNGKALLRSCLRSVVDGTFPHERYEILVADDGSTEPETRAILAELEQSLAGEPGFFLVGAKSYGRLPTFLLQSGLAQLEIVMDMLGAPSR